MKRIMIILGFIGALGGAIAFISDADARYAKSSELQAVSDRLDNKIDKDRKHDIQEQMWAIENRFYPMFKEEYGRPPKDIEELIGYMDERSRTQYLELREEYELLVEKAKAKARDN